MEKTKEQVRADARQRKRNQRERDYAARDAGCLESMDPAERRVQEIFEKIAEEPRQPQRIIPVQGDPEPAQLPTPGQWLAFLRSINPSEAIRGEIARVEAAVASGLVEFQADFRRSSDE